MKVRVLFSRIYEHATEFKKKKKKQDFRGEKNNLEPSSMRELLS